MLKSRKSLAILSCAAVPVLCGLSAAMAQDVVTPTQYADGNPPTLPGFWPSSVTNANQGASATGTDPVVASNFFGGVFNNNMNGAPNNGDSGIVSGGTPPSTPASGALVNVLLGSGSNFVVFGQTFKTTSSFKLGGVSFDMVGGADAGFQANAASIHLYQLNSTVTGTSASYNISTQAVGGVNGDLLGGGQGAVWTPSGVSNLNQFVFTGADQVTLQANTEYAFELYVDSVDSGDSIGLMRTSGSNTLPSPQPYTDGQLYAVGTGQAGFSQQFYSANSTFDRSDAAFAGTGLVRESIFAVYGAAPATTAGTWTGTAADANWATPGNWVSNAVPGTTAGDSALFAGANNTATTQLVNLNGNQTVGTITFNNAGSLYTIAQGTSGTLNLHAATGTAHIDDLIGDPTSPNTLTGHTISAPISLFNGVQIAVGQVQDVLTFSGNISGAGGVTLLGDNSSQMVGTVVFSGQNSYTGGTTISSGTLLIQRSATPSATLSGLAAGPVTIGTISSAGSLVLGTNVTLGSQSANPPGTSPTSNVNITSLSITSNSTFDIGNNHIIIKYGSGPDPIASVAAWIVSGAYAGATPGVAAPTWTGTGITSSAAKANLLSYGIGYADSADPGNPAGLASGQIEIMYTLLGDANLDGKVNGTDFAILATDFNQAVSGWDGGDFNYDGKANGSDFAFIATNFNQGASQSAEAAALDAFAAANGLLTSVPEPASAGLLALGALGMLKRRRRQENA